MFLSSVYSALIGTSEIPMSPLVSSVRLHDFLAGLCNSLSMSFDQSNITIIGPIYLLICFHPSYIPFNTILKTESRRVWLMQFVCIFTARRS